MRYQHHRGDALDKAFSWLSCSVVAAGAVLRLWQYLGRSALWTDEATVANNIVARCYEQLLMLPLAGNQAAPVGFLIIEKAAASVFGPNELALRAYPLLCALVSLLLLRRAARRLLPAAGVLLALIPFAFSRPLLFHAAEVKQYSSDVAIALALLLVALELLEPERPTQVLVGAAVIGALGVWLSQPAVLVVTGLGAALALAACIDAVRGRRGAGSLAPLAAIVAVWALSAMAATVVSLRHLTPTSHHFMQVFWSDGFWPLSLAHPSSVAWPIVRVAYILGNQLGIPTSVGFACAALVVIGAALTWRKNWRTALLLFAPLIVALGASVMRQYPFGDRLAIFLVPSLLLLAAIGIVELAALIPVRNGAALVLTGAAALLLVVEAQALYGAPPVYRREEITPALAQLRSRSAPTDAGYVYYGGVAAYEFYDSGDPLPAGAVMGGCHRGDAHAYLAELDHFRGRARVWLLFAHESRGLRERETMLAYLNAIGAVRDSVISLGRDTDGQTTSVRLYLYDLSDAAKLEATSASGFAIPAPQMLAERQKCQPASD